MRINPRRAAYVALKLAVTSDAIFYTGIAQAQQGHLGKYFEKVTGRAAWFCSSAFYFTKSHPEAQAVITTQALSKSVLRGFHPLPGEVAQ